MAGLTKGVRTGLTKRLIFFKVVVQSPKKNKSGCHLSGGMAFRPSGIASFTAQKDRI